MVDYFLATFDIWFNAFYFSLYHAYCEIDTYRERKNSILKHLWIMWFVAWLEENVIPGR